MNDIKEITSKRVKELIRQQNLSIPQLAELLGVQPDTAKTYINGRTLLPVESAALLRNNCNVSLDWIYGQDDSRNHSDTIADIIIALERVLRVSERENCYGEPELVLRIDKTFHQFCTDVSTLSQFPLMEASDGKTLHQEAQKLLRAKYKDYFCKNISSEKFSENSEIDISHVDNLTVVDMLSAAVLKEN